MTSLRTLTLTALTLSFGLTAGPPASAEPLAYLMGDLADTGPSTIVQTDTLFLVDLATGEAEVIGQVAGPDCIGTSNVCPSIGGISVDPLTGTLYGVVDVGDQLITIDPDTALATEIDVLTLAGTPIASISGFGLTHDDAGTLYFVSSTGHRLAELDATNAYLHDIATSPDGPNATNVADAGATHLYAMERVISSTFQLVTLEKTPPGDPLPMNFLTVIGTVSPDPTSTHFGLDLAPDGTLWGAQRGPSDAGGELFKLNTTTAALTDVTEITVPASSQVVVQPTSLSILPDGSPAFGTGNPWLAGMPNGSTDDGNDVAPDESPRRALLIDLSTAVSLTFSATGGSHLAPGCPIPATFPACSPPDGSVTVGPHTASVSGDSNGIANLVAPYSALVGVFLDDTQPDLSAAPSGLDFSMSGLGTDFVSLSPELRQPFFIGDGQTSGMQQQVFHVPSGATRLYLGTHDGTGWFNNTGRLDVTIVANEAPMVPMSGLVQSCLIATALLALGWSMVRRRTQEV